jgi:hypothetical protein
MMRLGVVRTGFRSTGIFAVTALVASAALVPLDGVPASASVPPPPNGGIVLEIKKVNG